MVTVGDAPHAAEAFAPDAHEPWLVQAGGGPAVVVVVVVGAAVVVVVVGAAVVVVVVGAGHASLFCNPLASL